MLQRALACVLIVWMGIPTALGTTQISDEARIYVEAALDVMQDHSILRYEIDWPELREEALLRASRAESLRETYDAIRWALRTLGDGHSRFLTPEEVDALTSAAPEGSSVPEGELLSPAIGRVRVPGFAGSEEGARTYAQTLQEVLCGLSSVGVRGWIVDLRSNTGGDFWAMLVGLGPLLGEGACGAFVGPDGDEAPWSYADGAARVDAEVQLALSSDEVCPVFDPLPPAAVLIGQETASAGEAVSVAFVGRPEVRLFGYVTAGLSTANESFTLCDGAMILLATSSCADREGTVYGSVIGPNEYSSARGVADGTDPVLDAAVEWLEAKIASDE